VPRIDSKPFTFKDIVSPAICSKVQPQAKYGACMLIETSCQLSLWHLPIFPSSMHPRYHSVVPPTNQETASDLNDLTSS
jgi:hypothetical protein